MANNYSQLPFVMQRGVVEDNQDPEKLGRVRVRIFGLHPASNENSGESFEYASTSDLPWAEVMGSASIGLVGGVGVSSVLKQGQWVYVMLENNDPNKPIVVGTLVGKNSASSEGQASGGQGFCDPSGKYPPTSMPVEPLQDDGVTPGVVGSRANRSDFHPKMDGSYGSTIILQTESGHLIELEDTDGAQRVKISHTSGSFFYIDNSGNINFRGVNNLNFDVANNTTINTGGSLTIVAGGAMTTTTSGNFAVTAPRIDLN